MRPILSRLRSNSVPTLGLINVSVQEAGIIFSAAERAAARRRRPMSEFSPSPSVLNQIGDQTSPSPVEVNRSAAPDRPCHLANQLSTSSDSSSSTVEPLPASIEIGLEVLASTKETAPSYSARYSPLQIAMPSPKSPKRFVANQALKEYADSLFLFTQSRLNDTVPFSQMPTDVSLLVPHIEVTEPTTTTPDIEVSELPEGRHPFRPPLQSHFSDWTSTDTDSIAELSDTGSLHFDSSRNSGFYTPDMEASGLMSPDSFFAEVTPKVNQSSQWTDTPNDISLASSPTRGCWSSQASASVSSSRPGTRSTSLSVEGGYSYFAGFDGAATTVEEQALPMQESSEIPRSSFILSAQSTRSNNLNLKVMLSSASDTTPFFAKRVDGVNSIPLNGGGPTQQMMEIETRPPSWLLRAIC